MQWDDPHQRAPTVSVEAGGVSTSVDQCLEHLCGAPEVVSMCGGGDSHIHTHGTPEVVSVWGGS